MTVFCHFQVKEHWTQTAQDMLHKAHRAWDMEHRGNEESGSSCQVDVYHHWPVHCGCIL